MFSMNRGEEVTGEDSATLWAEISRLRATVVELERQVGELDRLAHQDALVLLPNRRGFERQLVKLIDRIERYGDSGALLFIDVDGLKALNDSFGHSAGDAALVHVAELLVGGVRQSDTVARFGGDEFAVLLERVDLAHASETAARLTDRIAGTSFSYEGRAIPLSAAIGITEIVGGDTPEAVVARADRAMYEQKAAA
jgi:diguanylate cyclase (GGDEF)-like protein